MDVQVIQDLVTSWSILLIPIVLGLTQAIKSILGESLSGKWAPVISLGSGVVLGLLVVGLDRTGAIVGIVIGLSASGLWSAAKSPFKK